MHHRYRDFKKYLRQIHDGKATDSARQAVESLVSVHTYYLLQSITLSYHHYQRS